MPNFGTGSQIFGKIISFCVNRDFDCSNISAVKDTLIELGHLHKQFIAYSKAQVISKYMVALHSSMREVLTSEDNSDQYVEAWSHTLGFVTYYMLIGYFKDAKFQHSGTIYQMMNRIKKVRYCLKLMV
jgi:hypothetical protein